MAFKLNKGKFNFGEGTKGYGSPNKIKNVLSKVVGGPAGVALGVGELGMMGKNYLEGKAQERDMNASFGPGWKKWEDLTAEQKQANLITKTRINTQHEELGGPKSVTFYDTYSKEKREKYN